MISDFVIITFERFERGIRRYVSLSCWWREKKRAVHSDFQYFLKKGSGNVIMNSQPDFIVPEISLSVFLSMWNSPDTPPQSWYDPTGLEQRHLSFNLSASRISWWILYALRVFDLQSNSKALASFDIPDRHGNFYQALHSQEPLLEGLDLYLRN